MRTSDSGEGLEAGEGSGHEAEEENEESCQSGEAAGRVERGGVVNWGDTEKANSEEKKSPHIPSGPEVAEGKKRKREEPGEEAMNTSADGAKNVSAVELTGREKIQRGGEKADPSGAADGVKEENVGRCAGVNDPGEKAKKQRHAEHDVSVCGVDDAGSDLGVKNTKDESGHGKKEADQRTGSADIEESAGGSNRRTNHDERAEGSDERWKGNEKRIAGVNVVVAAGEEVAELVSEKNDEQRGGKGQAGEKASWVFVKKREGAKKIVERDGLVVSVRDGELRAGSEASAECQEKEKNGEKQRLEGRSGKNGNVVLSDGRKITPINRGRKCIEGGV